jgi:hypothetical protein
VAVLPQIELARMAVQVAVAVGVVVELQLAGLAHLIKALLVEVKILLLVKRAEVVVVLAELELP